MEGFPPELLAKIFSFLDGKDIASVAQVCRSFYDASQVEIVWRTRCVQEFSLKVKHSDSFMFKDVYTKLLHKFRFYLGLWQPQVSSYGGLFQVQFDPGLVAIVGQELLPPRDPHIMEPLRKKLLFTIALEREGDDDVVCVGGYQGPHAAAILEIGEDEFVFKCRDSKYHRHPNGKHQELRDWLLEEASVSLDMHQFPHSQELLLMKFLIMRQFEYGFAFQYRRVELQGRQAGVPIQPGIFKGTYGTHGLELVQIEYFENCKKLRATKLSGDPNVPAGQVTFEVTLLYSMVLTAEQQSSIAALNAIDVYEMAHPPSGTQQPFRVPSDCHERFHEVPKTCVARYHALGQVAGHGFTNPSFSRGHWIVFNEDLFGFLWLELLSLSMYHRVKEEIA